MSCRRLTTLSSLVGVALARTCSSVDSSVADAVFSRRTVVTDETKGARCAVAADFDGDGMLDLVSASSTDNTVAWYRNDANGGWSGKNDITYLSNGARIVTTRDRTQDRTVPVVVLRVPAESLVRSPNGRWWRLTTTTSSAGLDGAGGFGKVHIVTTTAVNAQGVFAADLDADGDLDLVSASSGDNTVAVYINGVRRRHSVMFAAQPPCPRCVAHTEPVAAIAQSTGARFVSSSGSSTPTPSA
eukprot:578444-Prymnesium_polylepis.1